jgi:hypothetical protein
MGTAGFLAAFIGSIILLMGLVLSLLGTGSILQLVPPDLVVVVLYRHVCWVCALRY